MALPIDPSFATTGPEWGVGSVGGVEAAQPTASFGGMLSQQIQSLASTQAEAAVQSQQLATGEASDPTAVVMAVEKAQLQMQLATTLRNKGVEAIQELMRTQV